MIALVDNHDSFTYNLVQALQSLGARVRVFASDALTVRELSRLRPRGLVVSPGPGRPAEAGVSEAALRALVGVLPVLGVCLGHQALCESLGGRVVYAARLMHGRTSRVRHDGRGLFRGLPNPFVAARYHSLAVCPRSLPVTLRPCAWADDGELMAVRHRCGTAFGVQFHPESFMTPHGVDLLDNFLRVTRDAQVAEQQIRA